MIENQQHKELPGQALPSRQRRGNLSFRDNRPQVLSQAKMIEAIQYRNPDKTGLIHSVKKGMSVNSTVTQRYIDVGNGYMKSAAVDPPVNLTRNIMVNSNQPATLYFRTGQALPALLATHLTALGIIQRGNNTVGGVAYDRYTQGRIPQENYTRTRPRQRTFLQWLTCRRPVVDTFNSVEQQQERTPEAQLKTYQRLLLQQQFLDAVSEQITLVRNLPAGQAIPNDNIVNITHLINENYRSPDELTKTVINALGSDTLNDVHALLRIAQTNQTVNLNDKALLLDMIEVSVNIRKSQVAAESRQFGDGAGDTLIRYKPVLPTGCDVSANKRGSIMEVGYTSHEAAKFQYSRHDFGGRINWNHHLATRMFVDNLTNDELFIEDAVGKSTGEYEKANAHWFARLYGVREGEQLPVGVGNGVQIQLGDQQENTVVTQNRCKFNQMSLNLRTNFFQALGLHDGNKWVLNYKSDDGSRGLLIVRINNNQYQYLIKNHAEFTPAKIDFLRVVADEVVDSLLTQYLSILAHQNIQANGVLPPDFDFLNLRSQMRQHFNYNHFVDPDISRDYSIEDLR